MITDPSGRTTPTYDYPGQSTPGYKFKKNGNGNGKAMPQPTATPVNGNGRGNGRQPKARGQYTP